MFVNEVLKPHSESESQIHTKAVPLDLLRGEVGRQSEFVCESIPCAGGQAEEEPEHHLTGPQPATLILPKVLSFPHASDQTGGEPELHLTGPQFDMADLPNSQPQQGSGVHKGEDNNGASNGKSAVSKVFFVSREPLITRRDKLHMLDLFSGTGSVGSRFVDQGYEVVSVDIRASEHPTVCVDVLRWKFNEYPPGYFDVIAAGPPCGDYSLAKNLRPRQFHYADRLVRKTVEIIRYFKPRLWWIENPRTGF